LAADLSVDAVMAELHDRVHRQLRERLLLHGASSALADPAVFAEVEQLLRRHFYYLSCWATATHGGCARRCDSIHIATPRPPP
jgi:hypothetical protein